jgi:NADP-dependent 3-hydroxy acid dehydrogenase YdfG
MTSTSAPVLLVLSAGPGLGMSVAHRFGKEGYAVALISRSTDRHGGCLQALTDAGVDAAVFTGDAMEPHSLAALRNYAITLNAALQPAGIYAGTIFTPYEPRQKQLSTRWPARGVVDCTGSPNRAAGPSLNVT